MYSYFKGLVQEVQESTIVLDTGDIGYLIHVSQRDRDQLYSQIGQEAKVYVYLNVKEDSHTLFGFLSKETKEIFLLLLSISGVGPKIALAVLSELSSDQLIKAVLGNNIAPITAVSGIGKKTAERLILELRDKFKNMTVAPDSSEATKSAALDEKTKQEVYSALMSLG